MIAMTPPVNKLSASVNASRAWNLHLVGGREIAVASNSAG
jgi:hypothetical protein